MPLEGIPLEGIADSTGDENLADWCDYVDQQPGFNCDNFTELDGQTMLGLALQGVPLEGIPLEGIPLEGIPLEGIPLEGIPVGTPLEGIPLEGIDLTGTPLGVIPLEGIDMARARTPRRSQASRSGNPGQRQERDPELPDRDLPLRGHRHAR